MHFDKENEVVRLCAQGMEMEGQGKLREAARLFNEAWQKASDAVEKFIAAHYVARHQPDVWAKLNWDLQALRYALQVKDDAVQSVLPSLYLNVGKCYEDLCRPGQALGKYKQGIAHCSTLAEDGYGLMIRNGLLAGLKRVGRKKIDRSS